MLNEESKNQNWELFFSALLVNIVWILFGIPMLMFLLAQISWLLKTILGLISFGFLWLSVVILYRFLIRSPYGLSRVKWRPGVWTLPRLRLALLCFACLNVLMLALPLGAIVFAVADTVDFGMLVRALLEPDTLWIILWLCLVFGGGGVIHILAMAKTYLRNS